MPSANAAIVYATTSNILRRIVHLPEAALHEPTAIGWLKYLNLQPGESWTLISKSGDWSLPACVAHVSSVTGNATIPSGRTAQIDSSGNVVAIVQVDLALDTMPGYTLVASDLANVGDHWNVEIANNFSRRYAVVLTSTRVVTSIAYYAIGRTTAPDPFHFIMPSSGLNVGDTVPAGSN